MKRKQHKTLKKKTKIPKVDKSDKEGKNNESPFESLLRNPGYNFIVNQICENLTLNDLAKCHRVSKSFRKILYHNQPWWIAQLRYIRSTPKAFEEQEDDDVQAIQELEEHVQMIMQQLDDGVQIMQELDEDVQVIQQRVIIEKRFPEWRNVFNYFENMKDVYKLQDFVIFMKIYFKDKKVNQSPIFYAIRRNRTRTVELLLMEASLNIKNEREESANATVLHAACKAESLGIVTILMKLDIDFNAVDKVGRTPLHYACRQDNLKIVKLLLSHPQIDYTLIDEKGQNVFHHCVDSHGSERGVKTINEMIKNGSEAIDIGTIILDHLVKNCKDLDINAKDNLGRSVAHQVYDKSGHPHPSINYLMKLGNVDFQAATNHGSTPLHLACKEPAFERISKLLKHVSPEAINLVDVEGLTPLHVACSMNYEPEKIVELLLKKNADVTLTTVQGSTPLHVACGNRDGFKTASRLLKHLQPEAVNAMDNNSWTPLHRACKGGSKQTVELLLKNNANVNLLTNEGASPLHLAAQNAEVEVLKSLIKIFPDQINLKDNKGCTILHEVCENRNVDCLLFLMKMKNPIMDFNAPNNAGNTPFHNAAYCGNAQAVDLFLKNSRRLNIDVHKQNVLGYAMKDIAVILGHQRIVGLIEAWENHD